jgi:hypothetical protein
MSSVVALAVAWWPILAVAGTAGMLTVALHTLRNVLLLRRARPTRTTLEPLEAMVRAFHVPLTQVEECYATVQALVGPTPDLITVASSQLLVRENKVKVFLLFSPS